MGNSGETGTQCMVMTIGIPSLLVPYCNFGKPITVNGLQTSILDIQGGFIQVKIVGAIYESSDLGTGF